MDDFNCGFSSKVTCAFLLQENKGIFRIKHLKPRKKNGIFHIIGQIKVLWVPL